MTIRIFAAAAALLPVPALAVVTVFNTQPGFEAAVGPTEALITSARQVGLADEVANTPNRNTGVGSILTFDRENTRLGRSFVLEALEGGGMTFDDDEAAGNIPLFDFALSIGDIDNAEDDDWEIRLLDNSPPMRAFGVVFRDNTFEAGETLSLLDVNGAVLDQVDLSGNPQTLDDFVGVVTDFDFFGVRFDEGAGGDDIAIADLRFAVPDASWTAMTPHSGALRPKLVPLNDGRLLRTTGDNSAQPSIMDLRNAFWVQTGLIDQARLLRPQHSATLLQSGRVLLSGGNDGTNAQGRLITEMFIPRTSQWVAGPDMNAGRAALVTLMLSDGRVLAMGGIDGFTTLASAELFDPASGAWSPIGDLLTARQLFSAALLDDGRVLVTGGLAQECCNVPVMQSEIYDPATGTFSATGSLNAGRPFGPVLQRLHDGRILVAGGISDAEEPSAEIYDPGTGQWTLTTAPARRRPTGLVLLPDGRVLAGGDFDSAGFPQPMEIYDPVGDAWSPAAELIETGQFEGVYLRFSRLPDGRAIFVGDPGTARVYTERQLTRAAAADGPAVTLHTATLLASGQVLAAGGQNGSNQVQGGARRFNPLNGVWTPTGDMGQARRDHTATLLADGRVLVAGGFSGASLATAELFDPAGAGSWSATGSLNTARTLHSANLLDDGQVVVIGGLSGASATRSVETWDPQSGFWTENATCLPNARQRHTATTLLDGRVLVVGGLVSNTPSPLAAIYDPLTGDCSAAGSMADPRSLHSATLLADGRVLVAGGRRDDTVARLSVEIYDPATNQWTRTAPLSTPRKEHMASLLPGGRVLVTGGRDRKNALLAGAEIFDPVSNRWYGETPLEMVRRNHRATVLFDGRVLVHGGFSGLASSEILHLDSGFPASVRPAISSLNASPAADDSLSLTGSAFTLGTSAGRFQVDPRQPMVVVRRLDNNARVILAVDPTRGWSATSFHARPDTRLVGGPALVTVWRAGVPSAPVYRVLGPALRLFADGFED